MSEESEPAAADMDLKIPRVTEAKKRAIPLAPPP